jgi:RNA polymerase sigma-70 factor (ECF subfamily)
VIDSARARRNEWRNQPIDDYELASDEPIPGMDSGQLSPELSAALARLPDSQREAVELMHLQDLSLAEAAQRAGTTPGAFKVRAHRGRARLREILEANQQERET